jgi:membrane protein required for colicin V production
MTLDIVYGIILLIVLIRGFSRGLIQSVFWLISVIIGIMAAVSFSHAAAAWVDKVLDIRSEFIPLVAFILVLIIIFGLFYLLGNMLEGVFKTLQINLLNKLAGAIIWGISWSLLFSCICWYCNNMGLFSYELKSSSIIYDSLVVMAPAVIDLVGNLIPAVKNIFNNLQEWFDQAGQKIPEPTIIEV